MRVVQSKEIACKPEESVLECVFSNWADHPSQDQDSFHQQSQYLGAWYSDNSVSLFDGKTFMSVGDRKFGKEDPIFGFTLGENGLSVGSGLGLETKIQIFDLRFGLDKHSSLIDLSNIGIPTTCMSTSSDDTLIAVGTELPEVTNTHKKKTNQSSSNNSSQSDSEAVDMEEESAIVFYDLRRSGFILGCYKEAHSDSVNSLQFHPNSRHWLLSGGADGLVNVFDIRQTTEDDALIQSLNSESSIQNVGWLHHPSLANCFASLSLENGEEPLDKSTAAYSSMIYSATDDHKFNIWHPVTGDELVRFPNLNSDYTSTIPICAFLYSHMPSVVSCLASGPLGGALIADFSPDSISVDSSGDSNSDVNIRKLVKSDYEPLENDEIENAYYKNTDIKPKETSDNVIRCAAWDGGGQILVTGDDDGRLMLRYLALDSDVGGKTSKQNWNKQKKAARRTKKNRPY